MNGRKTALYEILAMSVIAALCVAISVACYIRFNAMAQDAHALDIGLGYVQSIADLMAESKGDTGMLREFYDFDDALSLYFDKVFEMSDPGHAVYRISVGIPDSKDLLGTADITLSKCSNGVELFCVTASWQEDAS